MLRVLFAGNYVDGRHGATSLAVTSLCQARGGLESQLFGPSLAGRGSADHRDAGEEACFRLNAIQVM